MNRSHSLNAPSTLIGLGRISLGAIALSLLSATAGWAQPNPCPTIYYEEPFSSYLPAPAGCPANDAGVRGPASPTSPPAAVQPPISSQEPEPIATIPLVDGTVNVTLVNTTGAVVDYQVITDTAVRSLSGESSVTLRGLLAPTTITLNRQDAGLLEVTVQSTTEGYLEVVLTATTRLDVDRSTLTIDEDGDVFAN